MSALIKGLIVVLIVGLIGVLFYFSSGKFHRQMAQLTGYSTICIDGVKYLQFSSGATVKFNKAGQIELCN